MNDSSDPVTHFLNIMKKVDEADNEYLSNMIVEGLERERQIATYNRTMGHEDPTMKCHACLIEKPANTKEVYPFEEDHIVTDRPIDAFIILDVQPDESNADWRQVTLCHKCFHAVRADIWISQNCLRLIECKTPFEELPLLEQNDEQRR